MRWLLSEYLLKGVYLGLLLFVAFQDPTWQATGIVALCTLGGLVLALGIAAGIKLREGYQVKGRLAPFVLFLFLESSSLMYTGIMLGLAVGAHVVRKPEQGTWLTAAVGGGLALGLAFYLLRTVGHRWVRLGLSLALAVALVGGALLWFYVDPEYFQTPAARTAFGARLLLGIPVFYLLTFAGVAEETEIEIGAMCAALGLGAWMLTRDSPTSQSIAITVPILLYFVYTMRVLPGLRIFKHTLRGISYANIGRYRPALLAFRRALQLDPQNALARESMWSVHRAMDLNQVTKDPQTLALVDLDLCLDRAAFLLVQPKPSTAKQQEAHHLLELVLNQRPPARPVIDYWRAVAYTHARSFDQTVASLEHVLDPAAFAPHDPYRASILLPAWQLALTLLPELRRRVGMPQLALAHRRMEAIAAVERHLAANPEDQSDWDIKRLLYSDLTEDEYKADAEVDSAAPHFDHGYVEQLGLALIDDPARWQRGVEYLRLAARGLPERAPALFILIAQAQQRAGHTQAMWDYFELAKRAGKALGPKKLPDKERQEYFATLKLLAEHARAASDFDAAIENYQLFAESERSGLETLRTLADLHEHKGDAVGALRATEQGLLYDGKDADLLARKDKYYFSVTPEQLRARLDSIGKAFDVAYCLRKARALLDFRDGEMELIDWAYHLAGLAQVVQPGNLVAKVLQARGHRRRSEMDAYQALLEEVYTKKPEKFATRDDEEAWYLSCRLLGEMYLYELGKPDLGVACFKDYRKSPKSGADTMYKLGQCYEQLGDRAKAVKCYENVTAYDGHPLAMDAHDALARVQSN